MVSNWLQEEFVIFGSVKKIIVDSKKIGHIFIMDKSNFLFIVRTNLCAITDFPEYFEGRIVKIIVKACRFYDDASLGNYLLYLIEIDINRDRNSDCQNDNLRFVQMQSNYRMIDDMDEYMNEYQRRFVL